MIAEIISVGTELLLGQIVNTDAQYICQKLSEFGINVYRQTTVGDNPKRLKAVFTESLQRSDIVFATGGLGPTQDDLTKETIADALGLPMELHTESLNTIERFFSSIDRSMTENNKKQAYFPAGSEILPNRVGTAPGCVISHDGKQIIILPGPPYELKDMFENAVIPLLQNQSDAVISSRVLRIFGMGESTVETHVSDLMEGANPTVAPYAGYGEVTLRLTARVGRDENAAPLLDPLELEIRRRLGDIVYSSDDTPLHITVAKLLLKKKKTIAVAESCTGGMIASQLIECPGISAAFLEGYITYSNASKINVLGVSPETLKKYGAVSAETAVEMALGARKCGADIGLSITGIAGPDGGTEQKPVGLVYIGISYELGGAHTEAYKLNLRGGRERVRSAATLNALDKLRRVLIDI